MSNTWLPYLPKFHYEKIVLLQTIMTEKSEYQKLQVEQMFMGL